MITFVFFALVTITVLHTCIWVGITCWGVWLCRQCKVLTYERNLLYKMWQTGSYSLEEKKELLILLDQLEEELGGETQGQ